MRKKAPERSKSATLQINKETIRTLSSVELARAGGAVGCPWASSPTQTMHTKTEDPGTVQN